MVCRTTHHHPLEFSGAAATAAVAFCLTRNVCCVLVLDVVSVAKHATVKKNVRSRPGFGAWGHAVLARVAAAAAVGGGAVEVAEEAAEPRVCLPSEEDLDLF